MMHEHEAATDEVLAAVGRMVAKLVRSDVLEREDIATALGRITETGAAALRVQRTSVWRLDDGRTWLECLDFFDHGAAQHTSGARLPASIAPSYFRALDEERTIAANDARLDPRTIELAPSYLTPNGIASMLDAPIWVSGQLVGVVCHEHVGAPRTWAPWEELLAGTLADFTSMILRAAERGQQARALAEYGSKLEALVEERTRSLREEERFLQTVFATAPFGMAFFDRQCRYLRINDWLATLNGVLAERTLGRRPSEVLADPLVAQGAEQMIASVVATGKPTVPFEAMGHGDRSFLVSAYPIVNDTGVDRVCCIVVDVTAQRAGERELARALERERAARQEAEAASRAKDEFLAMLGHELRNPLAPLQTALQLMEPLGEVAERERAVIARQVLHLSRLVDDMLDVTRITRGKLELRTEPLELAEAVAKGIEMASPLLELRGHFLEVDVPDAGLQVQGDLDRLAQVVGNLLTNAAKFTPFGGRIRITGRLDAEGSKLVVSDNGEGIRPELLPRMFDAFVQGDRELDRSQGGLGLGLAIVHGIVTAHGGEVSVYSEGAQRGSEFTVRLPSYVPTWSMRARAPVAGPVHAEGARRRILLVDDNRDAAEMLALALQSLGHETAVAFDGPAALEAARTFAPDVALLDLGLPVMNGFELAIRLRERPGLTALKLVALTGYGGSRDRERSQQAGFDRHVTKPIDLKTLLDLLAGLFDSRAEG